MSVKCFFLNLEMLQEFSQKLLLKLFKNLKDR